jgi:alkanesulfonate monooxygenase SsuD/methylene tetrahydromethanopterin reductase-like flavin-dependent oxidoreductase (luciferase family)
MARRVGTRTKKIEIGTAVIDMRYENPMYVAEDAGAADIIAGGRYLGAARTPGSPIRWSRNLPRTRQSPPPTRCF